MVRVPVLHPAGRQDLRAKAVALLLFPAQLERCVLGSKRARSAAGGKNAHHMAMVAPDTVKSIKVPVKARQEMRKLHDNLRTVVNTTEKRESRGNSATTLANKLGMDLSQQTQRPAPSSANAAANNAAPSSAGTNAVADALRQDPDVIMVGELRTCEEMRVAISAAETGHIVLSTLHTNSASESVDQRRSAEFVLLKKIDQLVLTGQPALLRHG